jgi:Mg2+-importing ATPase
MLFVGPTSSVFDIVTFVVMWYVFKANSPANQALFQSGWFIESLLTQTLIVHMIRTSKVPFVQSRAAWPVLITTAVIMVCGLVLPFIFLGQKVGLVSLPASYFAWLLAIVFAYGALTQVVKGWYIRKFATWL